MAKFALFFTYTGATIKGLMDNPGDRAAAVRATCEAAGGRMDGYYVMFGAWDGFVLADLPDSRAAAAISLAVSSTGAFGHVETHELLDAEEFTSVLDTASRLTYRPAGQ